ncbi:HWE histidine kinase domain-containing protein [Sphingomonas sp. MMS24-JH45]
MSGFSANVTARKFAEEHREVLARELTHRVKNTLATVGAVVTQTLRDAPSLAEARVAVAGRIASLAPRTSCWCATRSRAPPSGIFVARVLAPFLDAGNRRFDADGPSIRLSPDITLALSMTLNQTGDQRDQAWRAVGARRAGDDPLGAGGRRGRPPLSPSPGSRWARRRCRRRAPASAPA